MSVAPTHSSTTALAASARILVGRFFTWWVRELGELLPSSWHRRRVDLLIDLTGKAHESRGRRPRVVSLSLDPSEPAAAMAAAAAEAAAERGRVQVRLPAAVSFRRIASLPSVAESTLHEVLGYEMNRLTPFRADDVVHVGEVVARNPDRGTIAVRLSLVERRLIEDLRAARPGCEIVIAGDAETPDTTLPLAGRAPASPGRIDALLGFGVAALAAAVLVYPYLRGAAVESDLAQRAEAARQGAERSAALQRDIAAIVAARNQVAQLVAGTPPLVALLEEIALRLPDDSWLTAVDLDQEVLSVTGNSRSAASLLRAFGASPLFADPHFNSAIVQNPQTGDESFALSVQVKR